MTTGRRKSLLMLLCLLVLLGTSAQAQEKKGAGKAAGAKGARSADPKFGISSSRAPIDITSDSVEGTQNSVTFKGNVVAKQDETTLYADRVVVNYDSETKKIKEIIAYNNVKVVQNERRATGDKGTFYQDENKIVLEGNAVVREGDNVIRGHRVTYLVDEERSWVEPEPGGGRVSTTITPGQKDGEAGGGNPLVAPRGKDKKSKGKN
jgi:lipopolysaccharide export system protein LptA